MGRAQPHITVMLITIRDTNSGMSDSDILAQIHANPGAMGNGGIGGRLL